MPTTMTIYPYLLGDACWVFDDARTGLKEEACEFRYQRGSQR